MNYKLVQMSSRAAWRIVHELILLKFMAYVLNGDMKAGSGRRKSIVKSLVASPGLRLILLG